MEKHILYMLNPWTEDDEQVSHQTNNFKAFQKAILSLEEMFFLKISVELYF